jgi:hypothetical protein
MPWGLADLVAHGGDHGFDALAEALVGLLDAGAQAQVGGAGFLRDLGDAVAQDCDFDGELVEARADVVDLWLGFSPEGAVCLPVFAPLFGDAGGDVFDAG